MFQPGALIFYSRTGVCRVEAIEEDAGRRFYCLAPLYQKCTIRIPVDGKVFMRPILTRSEANALIDRIPGVEAAPVECRALRELTDRYRTSIGSHAPEDLLALTMSIYTKKQNLLREKRKLGAIDERFLQEGEALLFGELAAALEIPAEDVPGYIHERLEKRNPAAHSAAEP